MYNRLDRIPACVRQTDKQGRTDRQTSCHGIVRAMHTRRAVKVSAFELHHKGCNLQDNGMHTGTRARAALAAARAACPPSAALGLAGDYRPATD